jgi:type II secretory pathway predicted ATPase ExeA
MFLDHYGFAEQPFGVTPDPRFLYLSGSRREALASLLYGIETGRGLHLLVAEPGMGKTTLLVHLLQSLRNTTQSAYIFETQCTRLALLRQILAECGAGTRETDPVRLHAQLQDLLLRVARKGSRFLLVVDEAQNLDEEALEAVRLLSDCETTKTKLLQIVLAGQPPLASKLRSARLVQLRQRISGISRLKPLNQQEVAEYVEHRIRVAARKQEAHIFTPAALRLIAAASEGVPRQVSNVCFHALSLGFARDLHVIDIDTIVESITDLELPLPQDLGLAMAAGSEPECSFESSSYTNNIGSPKEPTSYVEEQPVTNLHRDNEIPMLSPEVAVEDFDVQRLRPWAEPSLTSFAPSQTNSSVFAHWIAVAVSLALLLALVSYSRATTSTTKTQPVKSQVSTGSHNE